MPQIGFPTVTPVVKKLLILNFGIFLAMYVLRAVDPGTAYFLELHLGARPVDWFVGPPWFPVWQLVTSGFLHSLDSLGHIFWNMLQLYFFGTMLEGIIGPRRFTWVYLGAVVCGSLAHIVFQPLSDPQAYAIGASGGVLGVLLMIAVLRPNTRVLLLFVPVTLKWVVIGLIAFDVFGLMQEFQGQSDQVAHWGHLGGATFGFVAARRGWIWLDPITGWKIKQEQRQAAQAQDEDLKMDDLLAKIHRDGMSSLSKRERAFLKKVSNRS